MKQRGVWAVITALWIAVSLGAVAASLAGTTGKLAGKVVDENKQPLAGVNIRIEGLRIGMLSDQDGNFLTIGVPAGTYSVRANLVGYSAFLAENVTISPDFTTELNVTLRSEAIPQAEVRVDAQRPLLQRDATGTTRFLSASDIQKLPTRGYRDAAAQQTGVVNYRRARPRANIDNESQNGPTLIIRGGRPNETAYFVDGFSQQDPLTGTSSTAINNNSIEEIVVLTGGFNAEYGRIMSGAVNVVTREGTDQYKGTIESVSDLFAGEWLGTRRTDYNIYDVSVGGPLWPGLNNTTFYASAQRRWEGDRAPSVMSDAFRSQLRELGLTDDRKPMNSAGGYTFQGKIGWQLNDQITVKFGGLGSQDDWREYLHTYLFNLDHSPRYTDRNVSYFTTYNQVLSPRTYFNLGINYFETLRKRGDGVAFDRLQEYIRDPNPRFDQDVPMFYDTGHVYDDYLQRRSSYWGFQGSITSQVDPHHQLRAGADFQRHTLRYFDHFFPVQLGDDPTPNLRDWDGYGYDLVVQRDTSGAIQSIDLVEKNSGRDGPKHPKTWSAYVQDKFEREGVIVNAGLRFDNINVDTEALVSERFPLGSPDIAGNLPDSLESKDLQSNKTYARLSPRLGIAFPVDERTQLRFNYGQFYQQPNLQDLYVSYRFLQHKVRTGGYFVGFGNPNLRPERTTAYEVGVARQIGARMRFDVTAYYKDVKDLVQISAITSSPNGFSSYRNIDFATIKGLDFGFLMRKTNHVSASVNYSLSFAKGTGSVSNTQANIAWTQAEVPKQTAPLDFDQRHKISANVDVSLEKGEGPSWGGQHWFENSGINVLYNVASGTPYTPSNVYNEVTLANVNSTPSGPINSRYGPWTSTVDIKVSRAFEVAANRLEVFVWGLNVLDTRNPFQVYTSSGSAYTTGWLNTEDGQAFVANAASKGKDGLGLYQLAENDPTVYANPRVIRFGVRASF